ncbi:Ceramide synthase 1 [Clonorchis sinensis]|uniref:Ceramide synthase 1 n=1 Tax=Clonorchis sinensis TaxID=79923 RepID=A0A8T1LXG5_CLOSI|nr:Ceramide synthase 1 [Clonorchis sinensis]
MERTIPSVRWSFILSTLVIVLITCVDSLPSDPNDTLRCALLEAGYSNWSQAERVVATQVPSYSQFLRQTWVATKQFGGQWNCSNNVSVLAPFENPFSRNNCYFFIVAILGACLLTRLRCGISPIILNWARGCGVHEQDAIKVPESMWKGSLHCIMWSLSCYVVVLSGRYLFFHQPCTVWDDVVYNDNLYIEPPPFDLQFIYCVQMMHYLHSAYATLYLDPWRSDSPAMLLHHVVTLSLISLSFVRRFLRMGALVLFIHDTSDVLLEFTKLNVYFKTRHGKRYPINCYLGDAGFVAFAFSWFLFRLYWYPLKVLHSSNWCVFIYLGCTDKNLFVPFNGLLWILQILHIYWFGLILLLLFKILTGQLQEIEDIRENPDGQLEGTRDKQNEDANRVKNGSPTLSHNRSHFSNGIANGNTHTILRKQAERQRSTDF